MKNNLLFTSLILLTFAIFSCKKETTELPPDTQIPDPADTTTLRNFRVIFENMAGTGIAPENATVLMAFDHEGSSGNPVNLSAPLVFDKNYSTPLVKLPKGSYQLKKLIIREGTTAKFAIPLTGSPKASSVAKPLSISLKLDEKTDKEIRVEILNVTSTDTPESFGYPQGTFGGRPADPEPEMDKLIFIRALFKVGEVMYDSIPAQLIVKSWDARNEMSYNIHYLAAGTQGVYLSAKAVRYHLSMSKWGIYYEMSLTKAEVLENTVYDMGGEKAAKKLKTVYEHKIVNEVTVPLTKTDYEYHSNGQVKQKQTLGKRADGSNYIVQKDLFEYAQGMISAISSYDEHNALIKKTIIEYDNEGRVSAMEERKGEFFTKAKMFYIPLETRSGLRQDYRVDVQYTYEHGHYTGYYSKTMRGLNVLADRTSGDGNLAEGIYSSDSGINPYVHLGIPDLSLSQLPGHNTTFQWKTWTGAHPENVANAFEYKYDGDGYPIELLTQYKSYVTKKDVYAIKTTFLY